MKLYPYNVSFRGHALPLLIIRIASRLGFHSYAWNVGDHMHCDCGINLATKLYRNTWQCPARCGANSNPKLPTITFPQH